MLMIRAHLIGELAKLLIRKHHRGRKRQLEGDTSIDSSPDGREDPVRTKMISGLIRQTVERRETHEDHFLEVNDNFLLLRTSIG
jgi:hypothetical protein